MNLKKSFLFGAVIACCTLAMPSAFARGHGGGGGSRSFSHARGGGNFAASHSGGRGHGGGRGWHGGGRGWHGGGRAHWHHRGHNRYFYNAYFGGFGYPYYSYGYGYPYPYYSDYYPYMDYDAYYSTSPVYEGRAVRDYADVSVVVQVQRRLARAGYYRGAIDGIIGNRTRRAIRGYERSHGLPVNGHIDSSLLATMGLA